MSVSDRPFFSGLKAFSLGSRQVDSDPTGAETVDATVRRARIVFRVSVALLAVEIMAFTYVLWRFYA